MAQHKSIYAEIFYMYMYVHFRNHKTECPSKQNVKNSAYVTTIYKFSGIMYVHVAIYLKE